MKCAFLVWLGVFLAFAASAMAGQPKTLVGVVRDNSGEAVGDVLMHIAGGEGVNLETRTLADGSYVVEVPDGDVQWTLAVDERELLERGYFCLPDFAWQPGDPGIIPILTAVPLQPKLNLTRTSDGIACLQLSFDWADGLQPSILRQYRIERTTDMVNWEEVVTLALACPPMMLFDETVKRERQSVYRTVATDPVIMIELLPSDFQFIADRSLGWEGPPVVLINATEPLPETPVVAPEIRVVDSRNP
ncbi:MAG: hypothetical protein O3C21_11165 [Verrucomicrobia bacterium]|nr:hypothetical protein [Verrucomicrobiota bacterium]